jgi:hypothetical protein
MPDAEVVFLCDTKTKENLVGIRSEYQKLVSQIITVEPLEDLSQTEVSRWLKNSIRRFVQGDFLYIDCDTIITEDLSSISELGIKFGICLDKHSLIDKHGKKNSIIENDNKLGFTSYISNRHFNGGIIFCTDTPEAHKIFDRWHELWLFCKSKGISRDMPSLNMAIYENASIVTELNGIWNCQIAFNGLPFLAHSKIIHYFASDLVLHKSPFILASDEMFKKVKKTGVIPGEVLELLKNPKSAFDPESRIIAGEAILHVINSSYFEFLLLMQRKTPGLFRFLNGFTSFGKKIVKFFLVKKSRKKDGGIKYYY